MTTTNRTTQKQGKLQVGIFADKRISFDAFDRSVTSAVPIELSYDDLKSQTRGLWAEDERGAEMTSQMPVLVYKHDGKFVVFSNWPKVQAFLDENANLPEGKKPGVLKGRLVSKQLLKHMETVSIPADKQNEKALAVERDIQASHQADWNQDDRPRYGDRPQGQRFQPREDFGNRQQPVRPPQRRPG